MRWLQKKAYRLVKWCLARKWVQWALQANSSVLVDDFEKKSGAKWEDWQRKALVQGKRRWEDYMLYGRGIGAAGVSNDFPAAKHSKQSLREIRSNARLESTHG